MIKSNTKSNRISLPHGCSCTEFSVTPANWLTSAANTKTDWVIYYTFFDPDYADGKRMQQRGMNHVKNLAKRREMVRSIMHDELEFLRSGFNPLKKKTIAPVDSSELSPDTPFITALWLAVEKIKVVRAFYIDIRSVVRGVERSAKQLGIDKMPVSEVSRKYFKMIFEQCYKNNIRFTATTQNRYRKSLIMLYAQLIEFEAVEINPLRDIKKLKETKKERIMPTADQRQKIDDFLRTKYYLLWRTVLIFFHSGARETELMLVRKKDVDLAGGRCKYLVSKGLKPVHVWRPLVNSVVPLWREAVKECSSPDDYLFSKGLKPGPVPIRTEQLARRWRRHVKDKLGINVDFYTLKHLNTTELMDELDSQYNYDPVKDVAGLTAHTSSAMIVNIYDKNNKQRKDDKIKKSTTRFAK